MRPQLKYALLFLALYIVVKLSIFFTGLQYGKGQDYSVFANLLFIILCSYLALREVKKTKPATSFMVDLRTGAGASVLYALFVALYIFAHYKWIDIAFFPNKIEVAIEAAKQNPAADLEQAGQSARNIYSPFTHASLTLFAMSITGVSFSVFVSLLVRKNPFR